jgi:hypothetical protein
LLINQNLSYHGPLKSKSVCQALELDSTLLSYNPSYNISCYTQTTSIQIGSAQSTGQYVQSQGIYASNPYLHPWKNASGDLGLNYNYSCCGDTSFQQLLYDATTTSDNQTFGLDFRNPDSSIATISRGPSTMQLGGVSPIFSDQIFWIDQPVQNPSNHQFFLQDLYFCGVDLMGNYSNNWQVLIDSGSSCLTLPGEMYDTFAAWYENQTQIQNTKDLPAISFAINGFPETTFYIPLATLIVSANAIQSEEGAPFVNLAGSSPNSQRICVLRGSDLASSSGTLYSSPPLIVFGALALQSLYFSADFSKGGIGFANKLSAGEIAFYSNSSNPSCARPTSCIGKQEFDPEKNECNDPSCDQYFFLVLDNNTKECVYTNSAIGFGLFFIIFITLMEVISFFTVQFTALKVYETRLTPNNAFKIDRVTICIGRFVTSFVDWLLRLMMKIETYFAPNFAFQIPQPNLQLPGQQQPQQQQPQQRQQVQNRIPGNNNGVIQQVNDPNQNIRIHQV